MNRARILAVAGLSLLAVAPSARAQSILFPPGVTAEFTADHVIGYGTVTFGGYSMSPFSGKVNGQDVRFMCVDFFHDANVGIPFTATQINLGQAATNLNLLLNTREGSNGQFPNTVAGLTGVLNVYRQAAYLSTFVGLDPSANPNQTAAIQTAVWAIVSNLPGHQYTTTPGRPVAPNPCPVVPTCFSPANPDPNSSGYWINKAQTEFATKSEAFYYQFNVVTDINKKNDNSVGDASFQEAIFQSPEPGTWALMGTGLVAVAGMAHRRRRRQQQA